MERTPLLSTAIVSAGYDESARELEIEFTSGRVYRYRDVPKGVYEFLVRTPEKGRYFNRMIHSVYAFDEVDAPRVEQDLEAALRASLAGRERDRSR